MSDIFVIVTEPAVHHFPVVDYLPSIPSL